MRTALLAAGVAAVISSAADARSGSGCVRDWVASFTNQPAMSAAHAANQAQGRLIYERFFSSWSRIDFIALQCRMDPAIVQVIAQDQLGQGTAYALSPRERRVEELQRLSDEADIGCRGGQIGAVATKKACERRSYYDRALAAEKPENYFEDK